MQVQFIEDRITPHLILGERFIRCERFKTAKLSPVPTGHRCDRLHSDLGSMKFLLVKFVFLAEFLELLDNLIILSDLLVDRKQHGINGKHTPSKIPNVSMSIRVLHERREDQKERGPEVSSPPGLFVRNDQARAATASAQVSTLVRIASSEYEVRVT